jgi:hypothetical protein
MPGKTNPAAAFSFHHSPLSTLEQGLGKAMKAVPSARIPANKVNLRPKRLRVRNAHALAGKPVRAFC